MKHACALVGFGLLAAPWPTQESSGDPPSSPAAVADWAQRDFEGRWLYLEANVAEATDASRHWVAALAAAHEVELLTWIALARPGDGPAAARALREADAASWPAVALWREDLEDSHSADWSREVMATQPELMRSWGELHDGALRPFERELLAELRPTAPAPTALGRYRGPLTEAEVYAALLNADGALSFGARRRAAPGAVYQHQVVRAIRALRAVRHHGGDVLAALLAASRHRDDTVASEALRAWTFLDSAEVPVALFELAEDPTVSAARRGLALLAASYAPVPVALVELQRVAADSEHPFWATAIDRLADIGNPYTLERLRAVRRRVAEAPRADALDQHLARLASRAERELAAPAERALGWLEAAAYAAKVGGEHAGQLAWTTNALSERLDEGLRTELQRIASSYEAPEWLARALGVPREAASARVRDLAAASAR